MVRSAIIDPSDPHILAAVAADQRALAPPVQRDSGENHRTTSIYSSLSPLLASDHCLLPVIILQQGSHGQLFGTEFTQSLTTSSKVGRVLIIVSTRRPPQGLWISLKMIPKSWPSFCNLSIPGHIEKRALQTGRDLMTSPCCRLKRLRKAGDDSWRMRHRASQRVGEQRNLHPGSFIAACGRRHKKQIQHYP
jgi:hypothetical protein